MSHSVIASEMEAVVFAPVCACVLTMPFDPCAANVPNCIAIARVWMHRTANQTHLKVCKGSVGSTVTRAHTLAHTHAHTISR